MTATASWRYLDSVTICWIIKFIFVWIVNRPFPSSLVPLFQSESKCETFHMKMSSARSFFFMQIKVIFIRMVSHLDSLWNRGTRELGNGLLNDLLGIFFLQTQQKFLITPNGPNPRFAKIFSETLTSKRNSTLGSIAITHRQKYNLYL